MSTVKVLIADDSVVYRTQIKAAVSQIPQIEVVGTASNGKIALDKMKQSAVDLLILDLEMPEMNGIEVLKALSSDLSKLKVLVFSSSSRRGADITLEALKLGASDFVTKPGAMNEVQTEKDPTAKIRGLLQPKIEALFYLNVRDSKSEVINPSAGAVPYAPVNWDLFSPKILVIGSSTGGPMALEQLFRDLKAPFDFPILIAQHMPPVFTASLAQRLAKVTGCEAKEGQHGEELKKNCIYVAPGDYHMRIQRSVSGKNLILLDQGPLIHSVRPSVDALFTSAVLAFKDRVLGVVLTGMGADGRDGAIAIKKAGGGVLIQDKESCVVFGMPGAVYQAGAYDKILNLSKMAAEINQKVTGLKVEAYGAA